MLAGGAALLAQHLTARPTEDLDFFTAPERGHVPAARDALEAAVSQQGWSVQRIHDSDTFCRMIIRGTGAGVLVDLAVNAPPDLPASATSAGPTLAPEELAGHKLLALFDRAAARDFADVYVLAHRFGTDVLLARAAQIDAGFDAEVLASMFPTIDRPDLRGGVSANAPERSLVTEVNGPLMARRTVVRPAGGASWSSPSSLVAAIPRAIAAVSRLAQRPRAAWP